MIPGALGLARGQRMLGGGFLTAWLVMLTAFWIWIGTAGSAWAFVCASAIHAVSATIVFATCSTHLPRHSRVWRASLYGLLVMLALYVFDPFGLARRLLLPIPLEVRGTTFLINGKAPASRLRRGDWIAYRIHTYDGPAGFEQILALPGETIRFYQDAFEVGGTAYQPIARHMPTQGEVSLGEGRYFVWPTGARVHGGGPSVELLLGMATVAEDHIVGPAYQRWLWRKQPLEPLVELENWTPPAPHR